MKTQSNNQFVTNKKNNRISCVDILRILFALMIISYHTFHYNEIPPYTGNLSPGYIAVEAFFLISGYFLAKTAFKKDAPVWYRWTWRKLWSILPIFILGILFSVVIFSVNCLAYMEFDSRPLVEPLVISWFFWYLIGYGGFLYLFVNKGREKFGYCAIIISVACYLGTFFICGCVNDPKIIYDVNALSILSKFGISSFRSIGGMCLGIFICTCSRAINFKGKIGWKVILSIVAILCLAVGITLNYIWPSSYWDYLEILLFFITFFILFCGLGAIANKLVLSTKTSTNLRDMSIYIYIIQGAWVGVMLAIGNHMPELYEQGWYIGTYIVCMYVGVILLGLALMYTYKPIKNKLLPKFKTLNKI